MPCTLSYCEPCHVPELLRMVHDGTWACHVPDLLRMVHGLYDRSCPVRTLIFLWILRHEPLAGLGFMASLYYIGESRKGHRKIKVRTGHERKHAILMRVFRHYRFDFDAYL